jgi:EmrB/QacA subfamily drug resistance transporter
MQTMGAITSSPCDEGVIRAAPAAAGTPRAARDVGGWVLVATILGSSMVFIDGTVVNVALPALQRDLGATAGDVQWVVEAYSLFLASLILVGGSLGDRYGRRRIFATGIALFTVASAFCGLAQNVPMLIIGRSVQGIGGALLTPGSLAIISAYFAPAQRGKAIGTWSGFTTLTSALGPVLGGWLIQAASWRWIFFLNLPLAAVTLAIVALHVPESRDEQEQGPLDWRGAVLATLGLGAIVYALISAGTAGLDSPLVLVTLVGGVGALVAFVLVERVVPSPLLPLGLFRSRTFTGTNLLTLLLYGALGGALFFLPFNLQQVQGYTALEAGASLLPFTIIMFTLSRWAGGLVTRYGAKLPLIIGPSISAVGFVLFARAGLGESYWTSFFPAVVVLALGMSVTVAPLTTAVMGSVDQAHAGVASGVNNAVSRAAGLLAIAVLGLVVASIFTSQLTGLLAALPISPELRHVMAVQASKLAGAQIPAGTSAATSAALRHAIDQAFLAGFRAAMLIGAGLAAASAIAAGLLIDGPVDAAAKPPTQTADAKERRAS